MNTAIKSVAAACAGHDVVSACIAIADRTELGLSVGAILRLDEGGFHQTVLDLSGVAAMERKLEAARGSLPADALILVQQLMGNAEWVIDPRAGSIVAYRRPPTIMRFPAPRGEAAEPSWMDP